MAELPGGYIHIPDKVHYIYYDKSLKFTYLSVVVYFKKQKILKQLRSLTQKDYHCLQIGQTLQTFELGKYCQTRLGLQCPTLVQLL